MFENSKAVPQLLHFKQLNSDLIEKNWLQFGQTYKNDSKFSASLFPLIKTGIFLLYMLAEDGIHFLNFSRNSSASYSDGAMKNLFSIFVSQILSWWAQRGLMK